MNHYEDNPKALSLLTLAVGGVGLYFLYKKLFPGQKECVNCAPLAQMDSTQMQQHADAIMSSATPLSMEYLQANTMQGRL